jgi:hypothetical protein
MNRVDASHNLIAFIASAQAACLPSLQTGGSMRLRWTAAFLVASALASAPALAQPAATTDNAQTTETQDRQGSSNDSDIVWNLLGAIGLLGLFGFQRESDNDGYTDDPI